MTTLFRINNYYKIYSIIIIIITTILIIIITILLIIITISITKMTSFHESTAGL